MTARRLPDPEAIRTLRQRSEERTLRVVVSIRRGDLRAAAAAAHEQLEELMAALLRDETATALLDPEKAAGTLRGASRVLEKWVRQLDCR